MYNKFFVYCIISFGAFFSASAAQECPDKCICDWSNGFAYCARLGLNEIPTVSSKRIKILDASSNNVKYVKAEAFRNACHLEVIMLGNNSIEFIENSAFEYLPNLTRVDLSFNNIRGLESKMFKRNVKIIAANFSGNPLSSLADFQFRSSSLKLLDLSHCHLDKISRKVFAIVPSLQHLNLSGNTLHSLDVGLFAKTPKLKSLSLEMNSLRCCQHHVFDQWYLQKFSQGGICQTKQNILDSCFRIARSSKHDFSPEIFKMANNFVSTAGNKIRYEAGEYNKRKDAFLAESEGNSTRTLPLSVSLTTTTPPPSPPPPKIIPSINSSVIILPGSLGYIHPSTISIFLIVAFLVSLLLIFLYICHKESQDAADEYARSRSERIVDNDSSSSSRGNFTGMAPDSTYSPPPFPPFNFANCNINTVKTCCPPEYDFEEGIHNGDVVAQPENIGIPAAISPYAAVYGKRTYAADDMDSRIDFRSDCVSYKREPSEYKIIIGGKWRYGVFSNFEKTNFRRQTRQTIL